MSRFLTKKERNEAYDRLRFDCTVEQERIALCEAQDAKTLKAIGEWLIQSVILRN